MPADLRKHKLHVELIKIGQPNTPAYRLGITYPQHTDRRLSVHRAWGYPSSPRRNTADFPDKIKIPLPVRVQTSLYHRLPPEAKALISDNSITIPSSNPMLYIRYKIITP